MAGLRAWLRGAGCEQTRMERLLPGSLAFTSVQECVSRAGIVVAGILPLRVVAVAFWQRVRVGEGSDGGGVSRCPCQPAKMWCFLHVSPASPKPHPTIILDIITTQYAQRRPPQGGRVARGHRLAADLDGLHAGALP